MNHSFSDKLHFSILKSLLLSLGIGVAGVAQSTLAATSTWNGGGGDGNWSTSANWSSLPVAGSAMDLLFAGSTNIVASNDFTDASNFGSITFDATASAFTLNGNSITLNGNVTNNNSNVQTVNLALALSSNYHAIVSTTGTLTLSGAFTRTTGATVDFSGSGVINGSGLLSAVGTTVAGWATYNGTDFAVSNGSKVAAYSGYTNISASTAPSAAQNWKSTGASAAISTSGTINSLNMTSDFQVNSGVTMTLASGGIILGSTEKWLKAGSTSTSVIKSGLATGELYIHANATSFGNGSQIQPIVADGVVATTVYKDGVGQVEMGNGGNTFSGGFVLNGGSVYLGGSSTGVGASVASGPLGTGTVTLTSGTLAVWGKANTTFGSASGFTLGNNISLVGASAVIDSGALTTPTLSGNLSGSGALNKIGSGTLTLTGSNTYTGATTIGAGGVLAIGGAGQLLGANGTYAGTVTNSGTFNYNSSAASILSGIISGTGALNQSGAGALTLTAQNTYTGVTTVSSGTLVLNGNNVLGSTAIAINNGGIMQLNSAAALGSSNFAANGIVGTLDLNGQILTSGTFSDKALQGTITNSSAAAANMTALGTISSSASGKSFTVNGNAGSIIIGQSINTSGTTGGYTGITKNGSNTLYLTGSLANGMGGGNINLTINGGTVALSRTIASANGQNDHAVGNVTINSGVLKLDPTVGIVTGTANNWGGQVNGTVTLATSGTFDLNGSTGQNSRIQVLSGSGVVTNSSGTAAVLEFAARDSVTQTFAGTIQDGAGTVSLNFQTAGTTSSGRVNLFTGANTYTGDTTINHATFRLGNTNAAQNSTINVAGSSGLGTGRSPFEFDTTTAGSTTFNIGGLKGSQNVALNDYSTSTTGVILSVGSNGQSTSYTGVLSGPGSLIKTGTGTLTLSGANTYSGGTTINAGTVSYGDGTGSMNVAALGTGDVTVNTGGAVKLGNVGAGGNASATYTVANNYAINGGSVYAYDGFQVLSGSLTVGGLGGTIGSTFNGGGTDTNKGLAVTGVVSGSGNLMIQHSRYNIGANYDASFVNFSNNANTYSGTMTVNQNTTSSEGGSYLGVNGSTALQYATVNLNGNIVGSIKRFGDSPIVFNTGLGTATLGALSGNGNVVLTGYNQSTHAYGTDAIALTVGGNNASTTYSGVLSGSGSLTKTGIGTMTLSGNNTYTDATNVNGGKLIVSGGLNGTTSLNVASTAELNVNGSINTAASTTVQSGGILSGVGSLGVVALQGGGHCCPWQRWFWYAQHTKL